MPDIPERMRRNGRPVDPNFPDDEPLYMRCKAEFIQGNRLSPLVIQGTGFPHMPDQSVNRGKYSEPGDVLIPSWPGWGIAGFQVADVTFKISMPDPDNRSYRFQVLHTPEEENYAHSEIGAFNGESNTRVNDIPKTIRKEFRTTLHQRGVVIQPAQR